MAVLQIWNFTILLKWVLLGVALLLGLVVLKFRLKRVVNEEVNKKIFNIYTNSLLIGLFCWKGSLLVLEPQLVLKSPLSLLYFTGGTKGLIIAIIFSILYFFYCSQKEKLSWPVVGQSLLVFLFTSVLSYYVLSLIMINELGINHLYYVVSLFVLVSLLFGINFPSRKSLNIVKNIAILVFVFGLAGWVIYDEKFSEVHVERKTEQVVAKVETGIREGNKAPDFELKTLDGKSVKLSDLEGQKVILNFWATWCPPCKAEMPHMQRFYEDYSRENVEIIAVNLTTAEKSVKDVKPFIEDYQLTFPILLDEEGNIGQTYQAFTIPTSYIIDSNGIIGKKIIGPMDQEMMKELINSVR